MDSRETQCVELTRILREAAAQVVHDDTRASRYWNLAREYAAEGASLRGASSCRHRKLPSA